MDIHQISDEELVLLLKKQDRLAFSIIYDRFKVPMYIHALKLLNDPDEAQDIVQEVFTNLWDKAPSLNLPTSLASYLFKAVKNRVFNVFERKKLTQAHESAYLLLIQQREWTEDAYLIEKELRQLIEAEIQSLPSKMGQVFTLSRLYEFSNKEIAEQLNISDKTVKKQIQNALKILRTCLKFFL